MPLEIIREDITAIEVDCIVNPTDAYYSGSGGTDEQIHRACGPLLQKKCATLPVLNVGDAAVSGAYDLKSCQYIIHVRGPVWQGGDADEEKLLAKSYHNVLTKAAELKIDSLAIPLISTGTFGFPKKKAFSIATKTIIDFLDNSDLLVYLLVYDKEAFDISRQLFLDVKNYLLHCEFKEEERLENYCKSAPVLYDMDLCEGIIDDYIEDESFNECLRRMIQEKDLLEKDVYKGANLTKQAFNKIYNDQSIPKKGNVLALAIGLCLNIDETKELVEKAGYSFGFTKQDYIVQYFIKKKCYDIIDINEFLISQDLPYLGSKYE